MTKLDSTARKEISKCLNTAIDSEICDEYDKAYHFYVEGLSLVAEALKKDLSSETSKLTLRDKCHLTQFAKQSLERISVLLGEAASTPNGQCDRVGSPLPSAPPESNLLSSPRSPSPDFLTEESIMMARYHRRMGLATSALEKQNIELEMARQLVERATLAKNNLVRATAWALHNAHKKFQIQEKLRNGQLRDTDLRKQQLYTVSTQFNEGNSWLSQLHEDLALYPSHEKVARELLDVVLTDNSHPIKATINQMQDKINRMVTNAMVDSTNPTQQAMEFDIICKVIKDDINVIQDVLKALFDPLKTDRNSILTSEAVHHVYFSQVKPALISLIKLIHRDTMDILEKKIKLGISEDMIDNKLNECLGEAVTKLHYLTTLHNPYDMLDCTVHIIKLLATCKFDKEHYTSIGADDLLPRLCQVVIASSLPSISAEAYFMEAFMPSEKALGEEGYAVTMLQSAIAHITTS